MGALYPKALIQKDRYSSSWTFKEVLGIRIWHGVWLFCFRPTPKRLNFWRLFLLRCFGANISGQPFVYSSARVYAPFLLELKGKCCLGPYSEVYNLGPVCIGDCSTISQKVYICNGTHDLNDIRQPLLVGSINIGKEVFVGANAFIMPGISIGDGAVVGACAVVTKDVDPWAVVAGNPARVIKKRLIRES